MKAAAPRAGLAMKLRALKLPAFVTHHAELAGRAETEGWPFDRFLDGLADLELEERTRRRIERVLKAAHLPADKTLATLDLARLPATVKRQLPTLCEGGFIERAENLLAFGLPGRGKTHVLAAIGHELVQRGCPSGKPA
jgi:DNA replication protein DnaC